MEQTPVQKSLLEMVVQFAEREIAPHWATIDKTGQLPEGLFQKMIDTGFLSLTVPEQFGGAGFDCQSSMQVIYEVAQRCASIGCILEGHYKTVDQVMHFAQDSLKERYLPQANKRIFAFSSTEATGGSNILGIQTTAVKKGDKWVLNGNKAMITNGGLAEVYCVLAKTAPQEISCFLVDQDMPGFQHGKREDFIGLRGCPVGEIFLQDVHVPEDHLLGRLGQGIAIGDSAHYDARISMGGLLAGIAKHALDIATAYALERKAVDTPIAYLHAIQTKISDIAIAHQNILLLAQEGVRLRLAGEDYAKVSTMIKAYGSKAAFQAADNALQVLAGYGYSREYPVEHLMRDARALQIMEGSYEKMMIEISREVYREMEETI